MPSLLEEDSDEWLNISAQDFDSMLEGAKGTTTKHTNRHEDISQAAVMSGNPEDHIAREQAARLQNLAEKVEGFIEGEGDLEGARFEE
jgi:hypothetical protein